MNPLAVIKHFGVILRPSTNGFDSGGSTFGCAFVDREDPDTTYLYYSGSSDTQWSHAAIGLAVSHDGFRFRKRRKLNPVIDGERGDFNSRQSVTPAVVRLQNHYYMFFSAAGSGSKPALNGRKIAVARADDPKGPWQVLSVIKKPTERWEGWNIDLGPSVSKIGEKSLLLYYSNVDMRSENDWSRRIGILRVKVESKTKLEAVEHHRNPLDDMNGPSGSPNESLFCPGYLKLSGDHLLIPSMSTYSVGFPYRQFIGLVRDDNPFFDHATDPVVLIDGPREGNSILPSLRSQIAFDTPSTVCRGDKVFLYYSVMDRKDKIWKMALSIISKRELLDISRSKNDKHAY